MFNIDEEEEEEDEESQYDPMENDNISLVPPHQKKKTLKINDFDDNATIGISSRHGSSSRRNSNRRSKKGDASKNIPKVSFEAKWGRSTFKMENRH